MRMRTLGYGSHPLRLDRTVELDLDVTIFGVKIDAIQCIFKRLGRPARSKRPGLVHEACAIGVGPDDLARIELGRGLDDLVMHAANIAHTGNAAGDIEYTVREAKVTVHVPHARHQRFSCAVDSKRLSCIDRCIRNRFDGAIGDHDVPALE